jgi:hypothetical protein
MFVSTHWQGQCGPSIYAPITSYFGDAFTYVTWDYRGFFSAGAPTQPRDLSVTEHARDALEVCTCLPKLPSANKSPDELSITASGLLMLIRCCVPAD